MNRNNILGLTGEAGAGKTAAMEILKEEFGAFLIYADKVSAALTEPGHISYGLITEHFGSGILLPDGRIDRKALADIVYSDPEELEILESFNHPYVKEVISGITESVRENYGDILIVVEAALLLECGYRDICSEIWYISADEAVRRQRLKETRGYMDEKIDGIMRNQQKSREFRALCDVTIDNNGTKDELREALAYEVRCFLERGKE
ncbi:MAG: dephospho-CoA kinase [Lachnospiraceae bacterium]|nr:dephospho-CoA kinase [Lachnospiraceae bacterium]